MTEEQYQRVSEANDREFLLARIRELESVAEAAAVFFQDDTASHNAVKRLVSVQGALRAAGYLKEGQE